MESIGCAEAINCRANDEYVYCMRLYALECGYMLSKMLIDRLYAPVYALVYVSAKERVFLCFYRLPYRACVLCVSNLSVVCT